MNLLGKRLENINKQGFKSSKFLRKKSSVLMLSGGIDSTSVLKRVLDETDEQVYVHHIHLKNNEGWDYKRYKKEAEAVRKIVPYMKKTFRNFNYTESTIDTRQIQQLLPSVWEEEDYHMIDIQYIPDMVHYYNIAGLLAKITLSDKVYIGTCVEDYQDSPGWHYAQWWADMIAENEKAIQTVNESLSEIKPESSIEWDSKYRLKTRQVHTKQILEVSSYPHETIIRRPHDTLTKKQNIEYIGKELMNVVWYCREPTEKNGEFVVCHECRTCIYVDQSLLEKD